MKREFETGLKKLLVHGHTVGRIGCYSIPRPRDVNTEVVWELVLIPDSKDFGLSHCRDLSQWANRSNLLATGMLRPKTFLEGGDFHLLQALGTLPSEDEFWDTCNPEMLLTKWLTSLEDISQEKAKRSKKRRKSKEKFFIQEQDGGKKGKRA